MAMPLIMNNVDMRLDHERYEGLMKQYPRLSELNGDALPDREHVKAAYVCAGHAYLSNMRTTAWRLVRCVLQTPDIPDEMVCVMALLDVQISLDLNKLQYAGEIIRRLVALPQWTKASESMKNVFSILNTRINLNGSSNARCPELTGKKLEDVEWLRLRMQFGFRDGTFPFVLKPLMDLRRQCKWNLKLSVEMVLGELFFLGFENLDMAEEFLLNAHYLSLRTEVIVNNVFRPIPQIHYDLASVRLCNGRFECAFYSFLVGLPAAVHTAESWMRIALAAILTTNATDSGVHENEEEKAAARGYYEKFYSDPNNRKLANDVIKEELFRLEYSETAPRPEPTIAFAFTCLQRACKMVEEKPANYSVLQLDLLLLYIFVTLELKMVEKAFEAIKHASRLAIQANLSQKNVLTTLKAKALVLYDRGSEAVTHLNQVQYPPEDPNRPRKSGYGYGKMLMELVEPCYEQAFSFSSIEAMRIRYIYCAIKARNDVRAYLRAKAVLHELKHPTDISPLGA